MSAARRRPSLRWWLHVGPNVTPAMKYLPPLIVTITADTSAYDPGMTLVDFLDRLIAGFSGTAPQ